MSRAIHRLTTRSVTTAKPGMHADGGGLWLRVQPGGRSWLFRYKSPVTSKERLMGLGVVRDVTLAQARAQAAQARTVLLARRDPLAERQVAEAAEASQEIRTFRRAAAAYITAHRAGWKNPKHAGQWEATFEAHVLPVMGDKAVEQVETADVMAALTPIWEKTPETATRVRGRIELVLDYSAANGWRTGDNPARWRGHIAHMLPRRSKVARVVHHAALPYAAVGALLSKLETAKGTSPLTVRFAVLTAARSGEVRGACWAEIDLKAKVWTVPAERMKGGREHRVPLSTAALHVLEAAQALRDVYPDSDLVFPGGRAGRPLSDVSMSQAYNAASGDVGTVHGLRSTFRDWAAEATDYPREVAEMALAHAIGDKVEAAYRRGDLMAKRVDMMEAWAGVASHGRLHMITR